MATARIWSTRLRRKNRLTTTISVTAATARPTRWNDANVTAHPPWTPRRLAPNRASTLSPVVLAWAPRSDQAMTWNGTGCTVYAPSARSAGAAPAQMAAAAPAATASDR